MNKKGQKKGRWRERWKVILRLRVVGRWKDKVEGSEDMKTDIKIEGSGEMKRLEKGYRKCKYLKKKKRKKKERE